MASYSLVNIGLSEGLLLDGTRPLLEPTLTNDKCGLVVLTLGQFHKKCSKYLLDNDFEND